MPQTYENWDSSSSQGQVQPRTGQQMPSQFQQPSAQQSQSQPVSGQTGFQQRFGTQQQGGFHYAAGGQSSQQASAQLHQDQPAQQRRAYEPPADAAFASAQESPAPAYAAPATAIPAAAAPAPQAAAAAPQVVYAAPPEKKSRTWIVAIVVVVCLFAFSIFCVKSCTDIVNSGGVYGTSSSAPSGNSIAVIELSGTIQYDGSACSPEGLKRLLDTAADDDNVKGVVLRVNSGGGTATAGEEMTEYVRAFGKPIVVSSASLNASAAYELSSQADYIYVAKSTEIGAIGTAMEVTDLSGLLDMLGVDIDVIVSADSKDSSYGYRPLTDEERAYYQRMIDQINDVFVENVAQGRSMSVEDVRALATGLSFTGIDAVDNGLADEVGTLEDAVDKAAELAGVSSYEPYDLTLSSYDFSSLYDLLGSYSSSKSRNTVHFSS